MQRSFEASPLILPSRLLLVALATLRTAVPLAAALSAGAFANGGTQPTPQPVEIVRIWRGAAPGTEIWTGEETQVDAEIPGVGKVNIVTNVTVPTLSIFRPPAGRANGTAVMVAPGGAFRALAWDLDGIEVAQWLAARGITAFVLKYRVRPPQPNETPAERFEAARTIAIADGQQGLRLIRTHAAGYGVAPDRIGVIGFSAGAVTAMGLALSPDSSVRPNFAISAYGGMPAEREPVADGPPLFIVAAQDDPQVPSSESVSIFQKWTKANLPAELHLYEKGGHGFGMRRRNLPVDKWPQALEAWLVSRGFMTALQRD